MATADLEERDRVLKYCGETCSPEKIGRSASQAKLLRYLVESKLAGRALTRKTIAENHFEGRLDDVRVGTRVHELRDALVRYNPTDGKEDEVIFELPPRARGIDVKWTFRASPRPIDGIITRLAPEAGEVSKASSILQVPSLGGNPLLESLTRCGVKNAFRIKKQNDERLHRVTELIQEECRRERPRFRLVASSGHSYLNGHGPVWAAGLGEAILLKDARFEVVLESPFSDFAECRALANEVTTHHWHKVDPPALEKLLLDKPGTVSIRVTEIPVNCSLFFTSSSVIYDPYLWGRPNKALPNENNFWVFEFLNAGEPEYGCYDILTKHFDFVQENSVALGEFLGTRLSFNRRTEAFGRRVQKRIEQANKLRAKMKSVHP